MTATTAVPDKTRPRSRWAAAHDPVPGVPTWARRTAYAIPLIVLPSSLWRVAAVALHLPIEGGMSSLDGASGNLPGWLPMEVYVILLSLVSELVAFTALGMVARWGEVFPGWIPVLRGRRVPVPFAVLSGGLGAAALTVLWTWTSFTNVLGRDVLFQPLPDHVALTDPSTWQGILLIACYAPLVLWGPLLALLVRHYHRRRTGKLAG